MQQWAAPVRNKRFGVRAPRLQPGPSRQAGPGVDGVDLVGTETCGAQRSDVPEQHPHLVGVAGDIHVLDTHPPRATAVVRGGVGHDMPLPGHRNRHKPLAVRWVTQEISDRAHVRTVREMHVRAEIERAPRMRRR